MYSCVRVSVDRVHLREELIEYYQAADEQCRVVARAAGDLADTGQYEADVGVALTADQVVTELDDAPAEYTIVQRWNWWIGSLEVAYGGYDQFRIRRWTAGES